MKQVSIKKLLYQDFAKIGNLETSKRQWAKKLNYIPRNSQILSAYQQLVKKKKINPNYQSNKSK